MDIAFALDHDEDSRNTFLANFPSASFILSDIRKVSVPRVRALVSDVRPNPVLFCGCAPCQPFTKQNTDRRRPEEDDRVPLLSHFAKLVESSRPDIVFVENVPGLQKFSQATEPFAEFIQSLEAAGLWVRLRSSYPS